MEKELSYQEFLNLSRKEFIRKDLTCTEKALYFNNRAKTNPLSFKDFVPKYEKCLYTVGDYLTCYNLLQKAVDEIASFDNLSKEETHTLLKYGEIFNWLKTMNTNTLIINLEEYLEMIYIASSTLKILEENGYDLEEFYLADAGIAS